MTKFSYDFPEHDTLWGHADILNNDLEKLEYGGAFSSDAAYCSTDDDISGGSLLNFPEEEQDQLYADDDLEQENESEEPDQQERSDESAFEDRTSYQNTDRDDVYYFI